MKVIKIKKNGPMYKIILDNGEEIKTFDEVILKNNLLYDKKITKDDLKRISRDTDYYAVYKKVLGLINRRLRSEKELTDYMMKNGVSEEDCERIIDDLREVGLVNDYNFAKAYTNDRMILTLDGPYKIANYLEGHNIDSYIIKEMIDSYPKKLIDEHIVKIINKRLKANKKYNGYVLKHKVMAYLRELGYGMNDIDEHLDLITYNTELNEREMERFYKKYSQKYSEEELALVIKSKLLSRGFRSSDIDNFIRKKQG